VTLGICAALVTPWASSPLAARSASSAHTAEACLEPGAPTYPVRINVGTYRPPHPSPYGVPAQAPGPRNNGHRIENFRYLVSLDNSGDPADPDPANHPGVHSLASSSPVLMEGQAAGKTKLLQLPRHCRWLVTVEANVGGSTKKRRAPNTHKLWGAHVDLVDKPSSGYRPRDENMNGDVVKWVDEIPFPLPLGKLVVRVFPDTTPTNGAPDVRETAGAETDQSGLDSFLVVLRDASNEIVATNFHGAPICSAYDDRGNRIPGSGGQCLTGRDGSVVIPDLAPGKYEIYVSPPGRSSHPWHRAIQTTTLGGGSEIDVGAVTEGDDGTGSIRRGLVPQLPVSTSHLFGFVPPKDLPAGATGRISACAAHRVAFPPFDTPVINTHEPIVLGWVALSEAGTDRQVYAARLGNSTGCPGGVIDIQGVRPGNYTMFIWDERLERVFRTVDVTVPAKPVDSLATALVDEGSGELPGDDGRGNIGVFRWFGWVSGQVFDDIGVAKNGTQLGPDAARNGVRDCVAPDNPNTCERGLPGEVLDIRYRDGSTKKTTLTDATGRYEYPTELSDLYRFVIGEVESGSFGSSGPCTYGEATSKRDPDWRHSQYNPLAECVVMESDLGGSVVTSQLTTEGHRSTVDWGKYSLDPDEPGQIRGVVYYATTRSEVDPRFARAEPHEPGIPRVPVNLYWTGVNQQWDGGPKMPGSDDILVNRYADGAGTDVFEHPNLGNQGANGGCAALDSSGNPVYPAPETHFGLRVAPNCLELGVTSNETKDGTFDGRFALTEMCDPEDGGWDDAYTQGGEDGGGCGNRVPLAPGDYVVEVAAAENPSTPTFPYKVVKEEDVNTDRDDSPDTDAAPFACVGPSHVVQDARSRFDGQKRPLCTHREVTLRSGQSNARADFFLFTDTPIPGRISGLVTDSMSVETDPDSPRYGKSRAIRNIPVGIRDYSYRLLETVYTDEYGYYEAILPSALAAYCQTQAGACSAAYIFVINDPHGEKAATGTVSTAGRTVRGRQTRFGAEVEVGDRIRVGNEVRVVTGVSNNTSLTVNTGWRRDGAQRALYVLSTDPRFSPTYVTDSRAFDVMPGKTTYLDTSLDPISGATCSRSDGPELFMVQPTNGDRDSADRDSGVVIKRRLPAKSELRDVTINGVGFGTERRNPLSPDQPGYVTLIHPNGARHTLEDDSYYGGPGSPTWSDGRITFRFPRAIGPTPLSGAPYQVLITAPPSMSDPATALAAPTGITLHYIEEGVYDPDRRYVDGTSGTDVPGSGSPGNPYRTIQYALDRVSGERAPGRLIIVKPGVYEENPVLYTRAKLQGFGPGGSNGRRIPNDAFSDDVRRSSRGTVIDASFFNYDPEIQETWRARINGRPNDHYPGGPLKGFDVKTHAGAGITVVGGSGTYLVENPALDRASIDGFGIHSARTDAVFGTGGGGGIFVNGNGRHIWLTNNFVTGNHGLAGGGIILGQPYRGEGGDADNRNASIRIAYNRILGNGGTHGAGGVALYNGADDYLVDQNDLCSNFSAEQGGAVSHYGRSPGGRIVENLITFNSSAGEGGGLSIERQVPLPRANHEGTGEVTVERNVLSSNQSGHDGGAISVLGAVRVTGGAEDSKAAPDRITVVNNQLSNNIAAGAGGAVALRDSPNVWFVNNTIAQNMSTASCEGCLGGPPHSGGLASELHSDWLLPLLPAGSAAFSNPLLLNNLFHGSGSYAFDPEVLPAPEGVDPLIFVELRDFEVLGRPDLRFSPWHSTLSAAYETGVPAADATNQVLRKGDNPFVELYSSSFDAGFNAKTGRGSINISSPIEADAQPPHGDGAPGDYHLCTNISSPGVASLAADACSSKPVNAGTASLSAASFVGTVVPAALVTVSAPSRDIDGDARPIDARPVSSAGGGSAIEIGADEQTSQGNERIAPTSSTRGSGVASASLERTVPPATSASASAGSRASGLSRRPLRQGPEPMAAATSKASRGTEPDVRKEADEAGTEAGPAVATDPGYDPALEQQGATQPEATSVHASPAAAR